MDENKQIEIAKTNLERILSLFPRTDSLASVVLTINLGLTAILASNIPSVKNLDAGSFFALFFFLTIIISLYHVYNCVFPQLEGGYSSLIYFNAISSKEHQNYMDEFKKQSETFYLEDLIEQVWSNSKVLQRKFTHLKWAFIFLVISFICWVPALAVFVSNNTESLLKK